MANTAQLLRRQSSRDFGVLKSQKSIDQLELRVSSCKAEYITFIYYILTDFHAQRIIQVFDFGKCLVHF